MNRRRRISRQQKKGQTGITQLQIGVVAGVAIITVLAFIVFNQRAGGREPTQTASSALTPVAEQGTFAGLDLQGIPSGRTEEGDPALGSPDAPVTVVEYSDYQCPHCGNFARDTLPLVIKEYVMAGKVRYVHRDMAILGERSQWAAQAANCAADQGRFWEYHELLFQKRESETKDAFLRDNLKKYAADLGLDTKAFNQCLDQNKYSQEVIQETKAGRQLGIEGTPSFLINDELVVGNVPFSEMQGIIERHLEGTS